MKAVDYIKDFSSKILSDNYYILRKATYLFKKHDGTWETHEREAYDRGNGATILLYNKQKQTVILTKQFRLPTYINGNDSGYMIEACAGLLEKDSPEECIRRETMEETGFEIGKITKIFESYMSPGSVTEKLFFYLGEYEDSMKTEAGGGLAHDQEEIEVLEVSFNEAWRMLESGEIIDAKTMMLLQYAKIYGVMA